VQSAIERHYTTLEVAELWKLSPDTVRKIFRDEPGVLKIGEPERRNKQGYISLRIPESVLARVHTQRSAS
jgi:hypothetical protein